MPGQPAHRAAMKLLLVEDNPADVEFLAASLRRQRASDVEMVNVQSLGSATERLGSEKFDIVLLDLHLPDGCVLPRTEHRQP